MLYNISIISMLNDLPGINSRILARKLSLLFFFLYTVLLIAEICICVVCAAYKRIQLHAGFRHNSQGLYTTGVAYCRLNRWSPVRISYVNIALVIINQSVSATSEATPLSDRACHSKVRQGCTAQPQRGKKHIVKVTKAMEQSMEHINIVAVKKDVSVSRN